MVDSHLMFLQIQLENLTYKVFSKSKNRSTSKVQLKTIRNRYERIMVKILKMSRKSLFLSIGTLDKKIKSLRCHLTRFTLMRVIINFLLLLILYSLRGAFINKNFWLIQCVALVLVRKINEINYKHMPLFFRSHYDVF